MFRTALGLYDGDRLGNDGVTEGIALEDGETLGFTKDQSRS